MGETRDPKLGTWCVYEGIGPPVARADECYPRPINREIEWPVALTMSRIVDRVWTVVTVEIAEDFTVTHRAESVNLDEKAEV